MKTLMTFLVTAWIILGVPAMPWAQNPLIEVESNQTGILIPRMSSADRTSIMLKPEGLLVYDTNSNSFWYISSGNWKEISIGPNNPLIKDGDGDTKVSVDNGTDDDHIRFIVRNAEYLQLDTHGVLAFTHPSESVRIGIGAGASLDSGKSNIALGNYSLFSNMNKSNLIAIGDSALYSNTSPEAFEGIRNVAIGKNAMQSNTLGSENVALGMAPYLNQQKAIGIMP